MKKGFKLLFFLICTFAFSNAFAQITVKGSVTDSDGAPLPGAIILEQGTSNGTASEIDGSYSIMVSSNDAVLEYSFVGHNTVIETVNGREVINVTLAEDDAMLDEVVVTALGVTREKASLTYAVQEVGGSTLVEARENNIANAFSGKVSGLQVVRGSNGPASSSKLVLRGMSSLNGNNQPLVVVDGVPMDNFTGAANNDFWSASLDYGNGLGDLNPEDIESISILKGGAAAALYGSRAGNGVIMVTTKKGKARKGLGINFSSTLGLQSTFMSPDYQNSFGQGDQGVYDEQSGASWGAPIAGGTVYDNLENFYESGVSWNNSLSFSQQVGEKTSLYSSVSRLKDDSMLPGADYTRLNLTTRAVSNFGTNNGWTTDMKIQYINSDANNRPVNGDPSSKRNAAGWLYSLPRTVDVTQYSAATDANGNMIWYQDTSNSLNPYWATQYNLNHDNRDRFLISGMVQNKLTDWLTAELRGGSDIHSTATDNRTYNGGPVAPGFGLSESSFNETNFSGMLTADKENVFGNFGGTFMIGGNLMQTKNQGLSGRTSGLVVPNLFTLGNSTSNPGFGQSYSRQKINSLYGQVRLNYDKFFFVDITGRNDWSSTLSEDNRSFFYPSISSSFVISDYMDSKGQLPNWMDLAKARVSYAEVGNSLRPYQLLNTYWIGRSPLGTTTAGTNSTLNNPNLVNELIKTFEIGLEGRFFDNRLGMDLTWYKSNAINQLMALPMNPLSGYQYFRANAGDIQNKGIELMLDADVLRKQDFSWNTSFNVAQNENLIVDLTDDVSQITLLGLDNMAIVAAKGEEYGQIWGSKYLRVDDPNSPYYNQIVVDASGIPLAAEGRHLLGDQNPDAVIGWNNRVEYKNISAEMLIDGRFGGKIFSGTNRRLKSVGLLDETAVNNREDFVVAGVQKDADGNYVENTTAVSPQNYWQGVTSRSGNLGITEENVYDATNIRIRNIGLNYRLPSNLANSLKMQNLRIGASMNNVAMLKSDLNGIDIETVYATSTNALGFESLSSPTASTVFFNVIAGF